MTMPDPRHDLGARAERAAADWLERAGWRVLARRRRSAGGGEVDLIALDPGGVLVAIEVRARHSRRAGPASASVDRRRVARLERTLAAFAAEVGVQHAGLRVDLVSLEPAPGSGPSRWLLRRTVDIGAW
jgi:putative endonuclease